MKFIKLINPENVSEEEALQYKTREAARAIVSDREGKIAMLHATVDHYYKLPGGGVEAGEDFLTALHREGKEEIGCEIEVTGEVGIIVEYRKKFTLKQTSYCYLANLVGEKGIPELTQSEIDEGFETVWITPEEALKELRESKPMQYEGQFMLSRDIAFLEASKNSPT
jgi:8-oxo-dGTP diphosphatase